MTAGLTSIVIPAHNHAAFVLEAIESAIKQTAPVEVIVVNDGSSDETAAMLADFETMLPAKFPQRFKLVNIEHSGPSVARNVGIEHASGEFVMFLDADDVIAPSKVERLVAAMSPEVGWTFCDVKIEQAGRRTVNASDRYDYAEKNLGGWIRPQLKPANFIPIMAPLVRRAVIDEHCIRFSDARTPEDWFFWLDVAEVARVRYVPEVLATYRKRPGGRNSQPKAAPSAVLPEVTPPLRLNLGCGAPGERSWHPIAGHVNLDKSMGWRFEDGLGAYADGSVAGITISHALMYLPLDHWADFFTDMARVLAPGGIVRITEDDAKNPASARFGGWKGSEPAVVLIDAELVRIALHLSGLETFHVGVDETHFADRSLIQAQHGAPPDVFFIEGRKPAVAKPASILLSPHHDDETLFAAYTLLAHRPLVVVCHESGGDYGATNTRAAETVAALKVLGVEGFRQNHNVDLELAFMELDEELHPEIVWAPSEFASHPEHLAVSRAARAVFGDRVRYFHTYLADDKGPLKVTMGERVVPEPGWEERKREALACYTSQREHPRAGVFFTWDLEEYREP